MDDLNLVDPLSIPSTKLLLLFFLMSALAVVYLSVLGPILQVFLYTLRKPIIKTDSFVIIIFLVRKGCTIPLLSSYFIPHPDQLQDDYWWVRSFFLHL